MKNSAQILVESIPYIVKFQGKIVVVKYGGSAMIEEKLKVSFSQDIVLLKLLGIHPVVIHGGGKRISELMEKLNKKPEFVNGYRVTDKETAEIVEMVLSGIVNKEIVSNIIKSGGKAVGISGKDNFTILAKKKSSGVDIGFVGDIEKIDPSLVLSLIGSGYIPVVSPVGVDHEGNTYNINADDVASEMAVSLKAEKLIYLTDTDGIYKDINNKSSLITSVSIRELQKMIDQKQITGGMIPKVSSIISAMERGVGKVHIINGTIQHSILIEMFTDEGIGTEITL